jgi:hypothetical protein
MVKVCHSTAHGVKNERPEIVNATLYSELLGYENMHDPTHYIGKYDQGPETDVGVVEATIVGAMRTTIIYGETRYDREYLRSTPDCNMKDMEEKSYSGHKYYRTKIEVPPKQQQPFCNKCTVNHMNSSRYSLKLKHKDQAAGTRR